MHLLLAFSEMLAKQKELMEISLEVIKTWLRDILVYPYAPKMVIHTDLLDTVQKIASTTDRHRLVKQYAAVENAQRAMRSNANARLTLDVMVLQFAGK